MATDPQDIVDAIDAAILSMISTGTVQTFQVGGKSTTFRTLEDLRAARAYYADIAARTAAQSSGTLPFQHINIKPIGMN